MVGMLSSDIYPGRSQTDLRIVRVRETRLKINVKTLMLAIELSYKNVFQNLGCAIQF